MSEQEAPKPKDTRPMEVVAPLDLALHRRGNAAIRADVEDAARLFDPAQEKSWEQKYRFFSAPHMRKNYRTFARARHDPFNKDPSWGKAVIANIAGACEKKGLAPQRIFEGVDVTGDQSLNRPEMKRVLCNVLPQLSDLEIAAVFDAIDQDRSGEVNVGEFCDALVQGKNTAVPMEAAQRWRNPVHRINRVAPAQIEGWDHLVDEPCGSGAPERAGDAQAREVMARLGGTLMNTPRALRHTICDKASRHQYFGGGADSARFERSAWLRGRSAPSGSGAQYTPRLLTADPGPDLRPGFLCDTKGQSGLAARGFSVLTPRQAPGTAG